MTNWLEEDEVSPERVCAICSLLHSKGKEVTHQQVVEFLVKVQRKLINELGRVRPLEAIAATVLNEEPMMALLVAFHFGESSD